MSRTTNTDDEDDDYNQDILSYKIILLGDSGVGKTSLILRYCEGKFIEIGTSTIGIDTKTKYVNYNNKKIELEIWDTAGQERFKSLAKNCLQGADGIFLIYDMTQKKTFIDIKNWYTSIKENIDITKVAIIVIGNKSDLPDPVVKKDTCDKFCEQYNLQSIEASCKDNSNIGEAFNILIEKMIKLDNDYKQQLKKRRSKVDNSTFADKNKTKKKCCH